MLIKRLVSSNVASVLLASVILLSVPLITINHSQSQGTYALSPLEITAISISKADWAPALARETLQSLLFLGNYIQQAYRECRSKECNWSQPVPVKQVWAAVDIDSENWRAKKQAWDQATGHIEALMSAACVAVTLGGLACFIHPVKMTSIGLLVISLACLICPDCSIAPPMLFVLLLSALLFMGDKRTQLLKRRREIERELQISNKTLSTAAGLLGMRLGDGGGAERKAKSVKGRMKKFI